MSNVSTVSEVETVCPLTPDLFAFAEQLLQAGFRVWRHPRGATFLIAAWEGQFGFVQHNEHRGFSYSTRHKPNSETGSGFQYETEVAVPTVDMMRDCCRCLMPGWAWRSYREAPQRYTIASWLKDPLHRNYIELTLPLEPPTCSKI